MNTGIYEIVNTANGKRYVGSAVNFSRRWRDHTRRLGEGTHHTPTLLASWRKYGAAAFEFRKVLICAKEHLVLYEQIVMDAMKPEYNIRPQARSNLGVKYSGEARAKISAALKGNKCALGWKRTPEQRVKDAAGKLGKPSPMLGRKHSPDARKKISDAHCGKKFSDETKAKMSAAKLKMSPETRTKMSIAQMGKKRSPESLAKRAATIKLSRRIR